MENLPNDVNMLFSYINMKLRDDFNSLEELCKSLDIDQQELESKLKTAGFEYNRELIKFW